MANRTGGSRRKTRHLLRKHVRDRGKISISRFFANFKVGDRVVLKAEPAVQGSLYHRRFHGRVGTVNGKRGKCYTVSVKDLNKPKMLIVHPVHLRKA